MSRAYRNTATGALIAPPLREVSDRGLKRAQVGLIIALAIALGFLGLIVLAYVVLP